MKKIFIILLILVSTIFLIVTCIRPETTSTPLPVFTSNPGNTTLVLPAVLPSPATTYTPQPITPASSITPSPVTSTFPSPSPEMKPTPEGRREIKFETIKRGIGEPKLDESGYTGYRQQNKPFLWLIDNYGRTLPLVNHMGWKDRKLIRESVNFDKELMIIVFQGLTEGGWDQAVEIKRVWQEKNIITIESSYNTQGPPFHMTPLLPYHAFKIQWKDIAGWENLNFKLVDSSNKEITVSTLGNYLRPVDPVYEQGFTPLDFKFITPHPLQVMYGPYPSNYDAYRDPWLVVITDRSQMEQIPRDFTLHAILSTDRLYYYDEMVAADFDRYFFVVLFGGVNNKLRDPRDIADPGVDSIFQIYGELLYIITNSFVRKGPPFYIGYSMEYLIVQIDKASMPQRGNNLFQVWNNQQFEVLPRKTYNIP